MEIIGRIPSDKAELEFFNFLQSSGIEGTAWFNLDVPGTNEIDCLIWIEQIGFFVVEIKGYRINDFKSISMDNITFNSELLQGRYGHKPTPWKQSRNAARIISTYLNNNYYTKNVFDRTKYKKNECVPFVDSTVYFPFISEGEFSIKFPNSSLSLLDYVIFNECHNDIEYFKLKLIKLINIRIRNTAKAGEIDQSKTKVVNYFEHIKTYKDKIFLSSPETGVEDKYDFKLLKLLEKNDLDKEIANINFDYPIYRYGYAGTGKTVIALKILQHLAINGKNVLFTCFNKVLASDLKRLNKLSYRNELKFFDNITVKDIHDLIIDYSPFNKTLNSKNSFVLKEKEFEEIVDGIINSKYFEGSFDYIVIDEAQDLKDYGWKLIYFLANKKENSLIVLNGKEQNLYLTEPSIYLKKFEDQIKRLNSEHNLKENLKQKIRVYRNKTRTFLYAHSFLDHYPEDTIASEFILKNESRRDLSIEFDRSLGNFPYIISRPKNKIKNNLKKAVEHCLNENKKYGLGESGILIVVPWKFSSKYKELSFYRNIAADVLRELKLDYIDYTIDENRRLDYMINQVRIVSFHSCRGIEANFSIILGFEELFNLSEKVNCDYHKLGYIILSRAKYETYIFIDETSYSDESQKFIKYSKSIYEQIEPQTKFIF